MKEQQDHAGAHCDRGGIGVVPRVPGRLGHQAFRRRSDVGGAVRAGFVIGGVWLAPEHVRVRRIEQRWYAEHPDTEQERLSG